MELTEGTLLGGRVRYAQPLEGYRTGIEPVFLAAAVPARAGEVVLEAGTGAGAGLLCLAARVPGVMGVGVERDAGMAALCRGNLRANGLEFRVETGDVARAGQFGPFDHAFGNPPWHDPAGTRSPDSLRDGATHRDGLGLEGLGFGDGGGVAAGGDFDAGSAGGFDGGGDGAVAGCRVGADWVDAALASGGARGEDCFGSGGFRRGCNPSVRRALPAWRGSGVFGGGRRGVAGRGGAGVLGRWVNGSRL